MRTRGKTWPECCYPETDKLIFVFGARMKIRVPLFLCFFVAHSTAVAAAVYVCALSGALATQHVNMNLVFFSIFLYPNKEARGQFDFFWLLLEEKISFNKIRRIL
jgi:hypothetical protein